MADDSINRAVEDRPAQVYYCPPGEHHWVYYLGHKISHWVELRVCDLCGTHQANIDKLRNEVQALWNQVGEDYKGNLQGYEYHHLDGELDAFLQVLVLIDGGMRS